MTLVRTSSTVAVQMNGLGSSLWTYRHSSILAIMSRTEWNTPRRSALSVSSRNQRDQVQPTRGGPEYPWSLGYLASHAFTSGRSWAA